MVKEILARAQKLKSQHFKIINYTPKIERSRNKHLDSILLEYKRKNSNFRLIIKNMKADFQLLIRSMDNHYFVPY